MKLKSFCVAKDTITWTELQASEWKKIFTNYISDRALISKIYKEHKKLDIKKITQLKMGYKPMTRW